MKYDRPAQRHSGNRPLGVSIIHNSILQRPWESAGRRPRPRFAAGRRRFPNTRRWEDTDAGVEWNVPGRSGGIL